MADKCLSFDGLDDYAYSASLNIDGLGAFSFEIWVKTVDNTEYQHLCRCYGNFTFYMWTDQDILATCYGLTPDYKRHEATGLISDDTWHYIVYTYDGSIKKLYIDGTHVDDDEAATGTFNTASSAWLIGDTVDSWHGLIDEVRLSNIVRTPTEISNNWNGGSGKKLEVDANTIALYHFDEGSGGTAYDESGNNYDLTISGATWADGFPFPPAVTEKTSSDAGQGTEADALLSSACVASETGAGVESLGSRLLAASEAGEGAETQIAQKDLLTGADSGSGTDTAILTKDFWSADSGLGTDVTAAWLASIIAAELVAGSDRLKVKVESPVKGGDMKLPPGGKTSIPARRVNL